MNFNVLKYRSFSRGLFSSQSVYITENNQNNLKNLVIKLLFDCITVKQYHIV